MNYATKLCIVSMMSVFSVSSMGLVQAADIPVISSGGATYNIGLQGESTFTNSDNVHLRWSDWGALIAIHIPIQEIQMQKVTMLPLDG